jgi:hypothetical protein
MECTEMTDFSPIGKMPWLKELIIRKPVTATTTQLTSWWHKLVNLRVLRIHTCSNITELPDNMPEMVCLETFRLEKCMLRQLPLCLTTMRSLTKLELIESPHIVQLHDKLGDLCKLSVLDLTNSYGLTVLPESIGNLVSLERLTLLGCGRLTELPETVCNLSRLHNLDASSSGLKTLPSALGNLASLELLRLSSCTQLTKLPASIARLRKLAVLCLQKCISLHCLPPEMCGMTSPPDIFRVAHCPGIFAQLGMRSPLILGMGPQSSEIFDALWAKYPLPKVLMLILIARRKRARHLPDELWMQPILDECLGYIASD